MQMRSWRGALLGIVFALASCSRDTAGGPRLPAGSFEPAPMTLVVAGRSTEDVAGAAVTERFFTSTGMQPILGRFLIAADYGKNAEPVVVLSQAFWDKYFLRVAKVLGATIEVNGTRTTIVGVAPTPYDSVRAGQLWIPKPK